MGGFGGALDVIPVAVSQSLLNFNSFKMVWQRINRLIIVVLQHTSVGVNNRHTHSVYAMGLGICLEKAVTEYTLIAQRLHQLIIVRLQA